MYKIKIHVLYYYYSTLHYRVRVQYKSSPSGLAIQIYVFSKALKPIIATCLGHVTRRLFGSAITC